MYKYVCVWFRYISISLQDIYEDLEIPYLIEMQRSTGSPPPQQIEAQAGGWKRWHHNCLT